MSVSVRRGLGAALALVTTATTLLAGGPTAAAQADFYQPPSPLPAGADGDVIKSVPVNYGGAEATRIMYLSRGAQGDRIPVTGTVLVPTQPWAGPGERPIVAYAPFTAGLGDQCATSKTLVGEGMGDAAALFQNIFVDALLRKGFAVAQTDYQGLGTPGDHTYAVRAAQAHATLDVVRAAQRLDAADLPADGPVGIAGYSQGGGASAAAVELAPAYAPELDVLGAYVGAPPADMSVLAESLDGTLYVGFLGFALVGLDKAYPDAGILEMANEEGRRVFDQARGKCTLDAVFSFMFRQTRTLIKDGRPVADYLDEPPFDAIVADNLIGTRKPEAAVLLEHGPNDDVLPYEQARQLGRDWCAKGATVQFNDLDVLPVFAHLLGMPAAADHAAAWLAEVFAGTPQPGNCGRL
jgi:hypothetical protein